MYHHLLKYKIIQAVREMPDVAYGEQQALTEQQKAAPLPKDAATSTTYA